MSTLLDRLYRETGYGEQIAANRATIDAAVRARQQEQQRLRERTARERAAEERQRVADALKNFSQRKKREELRSQNVPLPVAAMMGAAASLGGRAVGHVGANLIRNFAGGGSSSSTTTTGGTFTPGSNIDIMGEREYEEQVLGIRRRRRRRRRLLTASDKADIAFLHGQLGGGQLGKAAISAVLSRRVG